MTVPVKVRTPLRRRANSAGDSLFDVDDIKGSTAFTTKPASTHDAALLTAGALRVLLLPLWRAYWTRQMGAGRWLLLSAAYAAHAAATALCAARGRLDDYAGELLSPWLLLCLAAAGWARAYEAALASPDDDDDDDGHDDDGHDHEHDEHDDDDDDDDDEEEEEEDDDDGEGPKVALTPASRVNVRTWDARGRPCKVAMTVGELRAALLDVAPAAVRVPARVLVMATLISVVPTAVSLMSVARLACVLPLGGGGFDEEEAESWWHKPAAGAAAAGAAAGAAAEQRCDAPGQAADLSALHLGVAAASTLAVWCLAAAFLAQLAAAERVFHGRHQYAKRFVALTSARLARRKGLPHFRLKNVQNIKAWLALRAGRRWLKQHSEQRVADVTVSTTFIFVVGLVVALVLQQGTETRFLKAPWLEWAVVAWCLCTGFYLLRLLMLGTRVNRKYQNTSVLLTEQINLQLRMLHSPQKKERLTISSKVLDLATKLLKELESPNKVSGLSMNSRLYNAVRLIVASAVSAALSDLLGYRVRLYRLAKGGM